MSKDKKIVNIVNSTNVEGTTIQIKQPKSREEVEALLGVWAMYTVTGRTPEHVTLEELESLGDSFITVRDATSLFNGLMHRERQLVERLIDDNAVKDIILRDKLNITESDYEEAMETREKELKAFEEQMKAEIAKAKIETLKAKDKEAGV